MSYQVFARKYRPHTFADLLGQDHVVRTLRNAIERDRIAQAYLFVGPRGTGKTSTARILAKALNCENGPSIDFDPHSQVCQEIAEGRSLDVLEIDGASNNSVDQIRDLRETVQYAPAQGQFKIYYIDEVHMLSNAAFNALLKTLEEPPPHVKFIFATTEPHKVLPTIVSRCQRFDLRRIPDEIIRQHLLHIAEEEGVKLSQEAALAIARGAEGGMRDAQSMLDQLVAFCGETIEESQVEDVFGITSWESVSQLAHSLLNQQAAQALGIIKAHHEAGRDLQRLLADLIRHWRNLIIYQIDGERSLPELSQKQQQNLAEQSQHTDVEHLSLAAEELSQCIEKMRWASDPLLQLELGLVRVIRTLESVSLDDVLGFLEKQGADPRAPLPQTPSKVASIASKEENQTKEAHTSETPETQEAKTPQTTSKPQEQAPTEQAPLNESSQTLSSSASTPEPTADTPSASKTPPSFDGPLQNPNPEPEPELDPEQNSEQEPTTAPYDDSQDYSGSLLDDFAQLDTQAKPNKPNTPIAQPNKPTPNTEQEQPTPTEQSFPSIPFDPQAPQTFWEEFRHQLPESLGIIADIIRTSQALNFQDETLHIGLPLSARVFYESELRQAPTQLIQLAKLASSRPLNLQFSLSEQVPEPEIEEPDPLPVQKPKAKTEPKTEPKPESKQQTPSPETPTFENDPAIQRALEIFEAEVLDTNSR